MPLYIGFHGIGQRPPGGPASVVQGTLMPDRPYAAGSIVRVEYADHNGRRLGQIDALVTGLPWKLNEVSRVRLTIDRRNPHLEVVTRPGTRFLIYCDNGLPVWGGVLGLPARHRVDGRIDLELYSGEHLLDLRRTMPILEFISRGVGYIFESLIASANASADTGVDLGEVWQGAELHTLDLHVRSVLEAIDSDLLERELFDFDVRPYITQTGLVRFRANLYERRGSAKPNLFFVEGANFNVTDVAEQGPVVNAWHGIGGGSGWGNDRTLVYLTDATSIARYGLREDSMTRSDIDSPHVLEAIVQQELSSSAAPRLVVSGDSYNLSPARWQEFDVGDTVGVRLINYGGPAGYETAVRVTGREFLPGEGVCSLVIE